MLGPRNRELGGTRVFIYSAVVLFLAFLPQQRLPDLLTHGVFLISQSNLYRFFFHHTFFRIAMLGLAVIGPVNRATEHSVRFTVASVGGNVLWAAVTAVLRSDGKWRKAVRA